MLSGVDLLLRILKEGSEEHRKVQAVKPALKDLCLDRHSKNSNTSRV